ncbi:MAG: hypothetical protein U0470_10245 [Anaerolineae bacterium]
MGPTPNEEAPFRDHLNTLAERTAAVGDFRSRLDEAIAQPEMVAVAPTTPRQCEGLRLAGDNPWIFLGDPAIEPTKQRARIASPSPAIKHRLSFSTQRKPDSRFIARTFIIPVVMVRGHARPMLPFLVEVLNAHYPRTTAPSESASNRMNRYSFPASAIV